MAAMMCDKGNSVVPLRQEADRKADKVLVTFKSTPSMAYFL